MPSNLDVILQWLHLKSSIFDFSTVDQLAKSATQLTTFSPITLTLDEAILAVEGWTWDKWKTHWNNNKTCLYQKILDIQKSPKLFYKSRIKDTIIRRLRLQQNKLNYGLHKLGIIQNSNCPSCGSPQTTTHFIMDCVDNHELIQELANNIEHIQDRNISYILSSSKTIDIIVSYILDKNIEI